MPSLKAYIVSWFLWWRVKGWFQSVAGFRRHIEDDRRAQDHRPPAHLQRQLIIEERAAGGCIVFDVAPKSELPTQARILYLHGGAFVFEINPYHWQLVATLAERLQAVVTVPVFPLGPEHSLMEIYDAVQPLYDELALPSRDNTPFFVVGDSAGATMALALTQRALELDAPVTSRLVLVSPVVDWTFENPDVRDLARADPVLDIPGLEDAIQMLCPELPADDPRVSPTYGELDQLPPMLVYAGTQDLLTPDIQRFVAETRKQGRDVECVEGEGMVHCWPLIPIPEGEDALDKMVSWLTQAKG